MIYAPVEASFAQITFEKLQQIDLADTVYSAVSLSKRNGVTFKSGALLIGADAIYRVDDSEQTVQQLITVQQIMEQNEKEQEIFKFIEAAIEIESSDAILLVFSDGEVYSLFENGDCEMIARLASKQPQKNLIDGQLLCLSDNMLINLKNDKAAELYRYVDKKLQLQGREQLKLASVAQTQPMSEG